MFAKKSIQNMDIAKLAKATLYSLLLLLLFSCTNAVFKPEWATEKAPPVFTARFETTKGNFDVRITREWSPAAADRFYQLVEHDYFVNSIFYRVVPSFVAQFGSSDSSKVGNWSKFKVPDEEVRHKNYKGTISFARGEKETRGVDLFINLDNNFKLDTINYSEVKGFPPFGEVIAGKEVVAALYSGYSEEPMGQYELMYADPERFRDLFPNLDRIYKAYIIEE